MSKLFLEYLKYKNEHRPEECTKFQFYFSISLKKLNGLLKLGAEEDELQSQVEIVEKSYDELLAAHYEYAESYESQIIQMRLSRFIEKRQRQTISSRR